MGKVPEPDDTITITFAEFTDACSDIGVEMSQAVTNNFGKGKGVQIFDLTALFSAELVKRLFKKKENNNGKV